MRVFYLLPALCLAASNLLIAQKESIDDIVPYRKGKLWGLVHHNLKEFYKPVFDSVIFKTRPGSYPALFSVFTEEKGQWVAEVIYQGKKMWLTADKKLVPFKGVEIISTPIEERGIIDEKIEEEDVDLNRFNSPAVVDSFHAENQKIVVKRLRDSFLVYINDVHIPEFTSNLFSTQNYVGSYGPILVLTKDGRKALANLVEKRLVTSFEYTTMGRPSLSKLLVVSKDGKVGAIDYVGKVVIPLSYDGLYWVSENASDGQLFIAKKVNEYFFVRSMAGDIKESKRKYEALSIAFDEKYYRASLSGKQGMVASDDKVVIPLIYDEIDVYFSEHFILSRLGGKIGFIDVDNKFYTVKPVYDVLSEPMKTRFKKNNKEYFVFLVCKGDHSFYIDNFGKEFIAK